MADDTKKNLPVSLSSLRQSLMAASSAMTAAGGKRNWMRVDDRSGAMTVGVNADPFPTSHRYAVNLRTIAHGFVTFGGPGGTRETMVTMVEQPVKPVPANGYVERFGDAGAKDCLRIVLTSMNEPGYEVTFDALGKSNANRVRNLYYDALAHLDTPAGLAGYVHPVIRVFAGSYLHREQNREIHHFDYEVLDWLLDRDGDDGTVVGGGGERPLLWSQAAEQDEQDGPTEDDWAPAKPARAPRRRATAA